MLVSWATQWIYVSWPKNYHIPKFVVQKWVRPIKTASKWREFIPFVKEAPIEVEARKAAEKKNKNQKKK